MSVGTRSCVVDAMTGQDAVNVASSFNEKIGIDGVIMTSLDGDTRGGAALSVQGGDRMSDTLCRHGRETFGSGAVLSGPEWRLVYWEWETC